MKTSESFANYFPVYGRVLPITPPTNRDAGEGRMCSKFMQPVTGRQRKSLWRSCVLQHGLDDESHQCLRALSNRLNAWSLSFMNMLKIYHTS